ncbi:NADP-dependent oxidoreductase domain-containing protein [Suillus occidentalis]|nr:NADP-dependent oxidoreductase domain-containing protein [Suillus occidentalis]
MPIPTLLLNDGTQIPSLSFGTGTTLLHHQDAQIMAILESAISIGFTLFDGAQRYKNEAVLGAAIKASESTVPRSELFISTKYAPMTPGDTSKTALYKSLEKLGLHAPNDHMDGGGGGLKEVWKVMEECKREGLARSIGVSNFGVGHLLEIMEGAQVLPTVNQLEIHPYVWDFVKPLIKVHKEHGIVTSSYGGLSPLFRAPGGPLDPVIEKIKARLKDTWGKPVTSGQVLNKWLLQHDILVVTTSTKVERVREYVDTCDVPELTTEEMGLIESAGAEHHQSFFKHTKYYLEGI